LEQAFLSELLAELTNAPRLSYPTVNVPARIAEPFRKLSWDFQDLSERHLHLQCHTITDPTDMTRSRLTQMRPWPLACKPRKIRFTHSKARRGTLAVGTGEAHLKAIKEVRLRAIKGVFPKDTKEIRNKCIRQISTSKAHDPDIKAKTKTNTKEGLNRIHIPGARLHKLTIHIIVNRVHFEESLY
jgi:hypothetical protein